MSTWLDRWDRRYTDRVRLLVEILPVLCDPDLEKLRRFLREQLTD